jgi:hypothetical protein
MKKLIVFDASMFRHGEIITIDGVNFITHEFRLDLGTKTKWFDHKSHSCGLKYEI